MNILNINNKAQIEKLKKELSDPSGCIFLDSNSKKSPKELLIMKRMAKIYEFPLFQMSIM